MKRKKDCASGVAVSKSTDDLFNCTSSSNTSSTYVEEYHYSFNGESIRALKRQDTLLFVAVDVCRLLEFTDPSKALANYCYDRRSWYDIHTNDGIRTVRTITAVDVCSLARNSIAACASEFESWVQDLAAHSFTDNKHLQTLGDVLNSILDQLAELRESVDSLPAYGGAEKSTNSPVIVGVVEPRKIAMADAFLSAKGDILIGNFAKHVSQSLGVSFGAKAMFAWLRQNHYLTLDRYPSQRSVDSGWLRVHEGTHWNSGIEQFEVHHTTRITPKGQQYFYEKLRKELVGED